MPHKRPGIKVWKHSVQSWISPETDVECDTTWRDWLWAPSRALPARASGVCSFLIRLLVAILEIHSCVCRVDMNEEHITVDRWSKMNKHNQVNSRSVWIQSYRSMYAGNVTFTCDKRSKWDNWSWVWVLYMIQETNGVRIDLSAAWTRLL